MSTNSARLSLRQGLQGEVLVVDDDEDFADSIVEIVTLLGFEADAVNDAAAAEERLASWGDVVLVDVRLGLQSGADLVARLRERWPEKLFIIMTAYASVDAALQALKGGAYDFLRKPFHSDELQAVLNRAFDRLRLEGQQRRTLRHLRLLEHIVSSTSDLMAFVSPEGHLEAVNMAFARAFDRSVEECAHLPLADVHVDLAMATPFHDAFERCVAGEEGQVKTWFELPTLGRRFMEIALYSYQGASHDERGVVMAWSDLTETQDLSDKLSYQATHDGLTGLCNRRAFEEQLARLVEEAASGSAGHALCYVDLDQFKLVNDTCGHIAGDELLRQLGAILPRHVRRDDLFARLGGDEFALLMHRCTISQASRVADELRQAIRDFRFPWDDKVFSLSASVGLVPIDTRSESVAAVMSRADRACYAAKDDGRDRVHIYREDDEQLALRDGEMQWATRVTRTLDNSSFELWAQRIVPMNTESSNVVHREVLLRMRDEENGSIISPGAFLPAAERYQLASRVDGWVFDAVIKHLRDVDVPAENASRLFINLSGQSIGDSALLERISRKLAAGEVSGERIGFEITETAAIANLLQAERFISALREFGCSFALDDFGSGLSSFGYLKSLPVDILKIDGMFVRDILRDPIDLAMVRSINEIGHIMGKSTVAEFVENEEIRLALDEIGVDFVQGYHIDMPAPLDT